MLQRLSEEIHETAIEKGFWDSPFSPDFVLAKIALIHSEGSEILEAYRKEQGAEAIAIEFADIIIRCLDLYKGMQDNGVIPTGLDIDSVLRMKVNINKGRPTKHGNLI